MATNPPKGSGRVGAVRHRDQVYNPHNDRWVNRDANGKFIDQKTNREPFKGIRKVK